MLRQMNHRTRSPLRDLLPKPDPGVKPLPALESMRDALRPLRAPQVVVNVYVRKEDEQ
jgi:hypothetical protein